MKVIVRRNKKVDNLIASGKMFEAFRVLRHEYSNYDAEWKKRSYNEVKAELIEAVKAAYPVLTKVAVEFKK
jgi:hypothetical protein